MTKLDPDLMQVGDGHAADRLLASQKLEPGSPYLAGEPPPSPAQVGAVLHALADHTLLMHLNGPDVLDAGADRGHLGPRWQAATAQGRFLQTMGDHLLYSEDHV